jgi:hypothetical protein
VLVAWTPLAPSRREQVLRRCAQAAACVAAAALLGAASAADPFDRLAALGALPAALAAVAAGRAARRRPVEVGVDRGGRLVMRAIDAGDRDAVQRLQCVFAAPWLITLGSGSTWVPIWPDSVPADAFRRFWVHIRWSAGEPLPDPGSLPGQPK